MSHDFVYCLQLSSSLFILFPNFGFSAVYVYVLIGLLSFCFHFVFAFPPVLHIHFHLHIGSGFCLKNFNVISHCRPRFASLAAK